MSRTLCLVIALSGLAAAPGCSSCFGGGGSSCRRPSFMEFRSPCRGEAEPCHAAPACEPACGPAPCCQEGGAVMTAPVSMPAGEPGTFS